MKQRFFLCQIYWFQLTSNNKMQVQWNSNKDFLYEERHESQNQQLQSISKKTKIDDIWILGYMEQDFF